MSPTARAAGIVALLSLSALVLPVAIVGLGAVALIVVAIADVRTLRGGWSLRRTMPSLLSRGVPERLTVEIDAPPGTSSTVRQASPPDLEVSPSTGAGSIEARILARRRGRHTVPGPAARVEGPLGLMANYGQSDEQSEVLVYPDMPAARRLALSVREGALRDPGLRPRGPLGFGTEFESIREYLPDDDIRQVNWRATARMGRPMSNQYRLDRDRDVMLMVDAGRLMGAALEGRTRLDAALDAVAAVCLVVEEFGDRCGVLVFDDRIQVHVKPTRRGARTVMRRVFAVEPSARESDYDAAFRRVERSKRALVLVLTDLVDEAAAMPLMSAVPVLARRHAVVVATAVDPDLDAAIREKPSVPLDAYRMVVAHDVLEARSRAAAHLRSTGAEVIEATAPGLAAACVRAYVAAKFRARL